MDTTWHKNIKQGTSYNNKTTRDAKGLLVVFIGRDFFDQKEAQCRLENAKSY